MRAIDITDIPGIRIGQVEDEAGGTGATVILCPQGMAAGLDVRGGGPASRDTRILDPLAAAEFIHAVLLAGGSAFGLDAAGGVQRYLEERGIGLPVGDAVVPLVCQSNIFDLGIATSTARPDAAMGYAACVAAEQGTSGNYRDGNFGAGCAASVGKALGIGHSMKTGIGSFAVQVGDLQVGAIMVLNALGDVHDPENGQTVAGLYDREKRSFLSSEELLCSNLAHQNAKTQKDEGNASAANPPLGANMPTNTTIGAIICNAALPKASLCKVASMAHDGLARTIYPVHTSMDGDSIYALSVGDVQASTDLVGTLAAKAAAQAVLCAARSAQGAYGLPAASDL